MFVAVDRHAQGDPEELCHGDAGELAGQSRDGIGGDVLAERDDDGRSAGTDSGIDEDGALGITLLGARLLRGEREHAEHEQHAGEDA